MTRQAYFQERYKAQRVDRYGDRKCRVCEILLVSRYAGTDSKSYCRTCVERGLARKDQNRRYYKANRRKILKRRVNI